MPYDGEDKAAACRRENNKRPIEVGRSVSVHSANSRRLNVAFASAVTLPSTVAFASPITFTPAVSLPSAVPFTVTFPVALFFVFPFILAVIFAFLDEIDARGGVHVTIFRNGADFNRIAHSNTFVHVGVSSDGEHQTAHGDGCIAQRFDHALDLEHAFVLAVIFPIALAVVAIFTFTIIGFSIPFAFIAILTVPFAVVAVAFAIAVSFTIAFPVSLAVSFIIIAVIFSIAVAFIIPFPVIFAIAVALPIAFAICLPISPAILLPVPLAILSAIFLAVFISVAVIAGCFGLGAVGL